MVLARMIGERYLWVDALCLVQDDEPEMQKATDRMDEIYQGAVFTIVAAIGKDVTVGSSRYYIWLSFCEPDPDHRGDSVR